MNSAPKPASRTDLVLLVALYAAEFSIVLIGLALHKLGGWSIVWPLAGASAALVAGVGLFIAALVMIGRAYVKHSSSNARGFGLTVAMNLITVGLVLVPLEAALRWLSKDTPDTAVFVDTVLLPRSWERATAHYRQVAQKPSGHLSYIVYDPKLGWTIGADRQSVDVLHLSSAEGLRSAKRGAVLAAPKEKRRIAVVGDSMTFAQGVKFEDSWAHLLETALGPDVEVLNFGVPGYGVDQAYLKFKTEVLAWKPDAVVLGFPEHNLHRTMTVYPFINWPDWDWPFSKPRLVLEQGQLRGLNVPTIPPNEIFAAQSVAQLPFVEYDQGYNSGDWEHGALDFLYVKRWLFARFPRWSDQSAQAALDDNRLQLNRAILNDFIRTSEQNRIVPLVVFFPIPLEVKRRIRGEQISADRALKALDIPVTDTTPCLIRAGNDEIYLSQDSHYSARGNAAVAECVAAALGPKLQQNRTASLGSVRR